MKYLIELPDVIKDADGNEYEPTGEWRKPDKGEWCWGFYAEGPHQATASWTTTLILRRKWTWPTWLKGWGIAMDSNGTVYAYASEPIRHCASWHSKPQTEFIRWRPELLGPPPPITDWTRPVLNPNYKGDA